MANVKSVRVDAGSHKGVNLNHYKFFVDLTVDSGGDPIDASEIAYRLETNGHVEETYTGDVSSTPNNPHGHFFLTDKGVGMLQATGGYTSNILLIRTDALHTAQIVATIGGVEGRYDVDLQNDCPLVENEAEW